MVGLGARIAGVNGVAQMPPVQGQLGELASYASVVEGMALAAEAAAVTTTSGVVVSGLPSTGVSGDSIKREKWGLVAAALAGAAGLLGLSRRSANPSTDPNVDLQDQE